LLHERDVVPPCVENAEIENGHLRLGAALAAPLLCPYLGIHQAHTDLRYDCNHSTLLRPAAQLEAENQAAVPVPEDESLGIGMLSVGHQPPDRNKQSHITSDVPST